MMLINKLKQTIRLEFIIFCVVAVASAVFELTLYTLLFEIIRIDVVVASPIAQIVGMIFNFILNKLFTFKTGNNFNKNEAISYFIIWIINLGVSTALIALLVPRLPVYPTIIRFGIIAAMFFINYLALKRFVFKKN